MKNLAGILAAIAELLIEPINIENLAKQYVAAIRGMVEINAINLNISYLDFSTTILARVTALSKAVVLPIGYAILAYLMVVELYTLFSKSEGLSGSGAIQMPLKIVLKIVIFKFLIDRAHTLLTAIFNLILDIQNKTFAYSYAHEVPDILVENFKDDLTNMKYLQKLTCFLEVQLFSIISYLSMVVVIIVAVARIFEIYIYLFIAPIPIATLPGAEISHIGKNFLKHFTAICLQGVILALILFLYTQFARVFITGDTLKEQFFKGMAAMIILTFCLFKSATWAKSICGAM